jgi:hypothetical protein
MSTTRSFRTQDRTLSSMQCQEVMNTANLPRCRLLEAPLTEGLADRDISCVNVGTNDKLGDGLGGHQNDAVYNNTKQFLIRLRLSYRTMGFYHCERDSC